MKPGRNASAALLALTALFTVSMISGALAQQPGGIRARNAKLEMKRTVVAFRKTARGGPPVPP